eukprot:GHVS01041635.1.p1 GENE.GHVS01041635.1~~GHVS01041635.1.p1  ORF type:complete len:313 (+),score=46.86 GHVS01041635.1:123-941(+)
MAATGKALLAWKIWWLLVVVVLQIMQHAVMAIPMQSVEADTGKPVPAKPVSAKTAQTAAETDPQNATAGADAAAAKPAATTVKVTAAGVKKVTTVGLDQMVTAVPPPAHPSIRPPLLPTPQNDESSNNLPGTSAELQLGVESAAGTAGGQAGRPSKDERENRKHAKVRSKLCHPKPLGAGSGRLEKVASEGVEGSMPVETLAKQSSPTLETPGGKTETPSKEDGGPFAFKAPAPPPDLRRITRRSSKTKNAKHRHTILGVHDLLNWEKSGDD